MYHRFDPPRLVRRTASSFGTNDIAAVAELLEQNGYLSLRPKSDYEAARLIRAGAIAVLYNTGRVSCRGSDAAALIALLHRAAKASDELLGEV